MKNLYQKIVAELIKRTEDKKIKWDYTASKMYRTFLNNDIIFLFSKTEYGYLVIIIRGPLNSSAKELINKHFSNDEVPKNFQKLYDLIIEDERKILNEILKDFE